MGVGVTWGEGFGGAIVGAGVAAGVAAKSPELRRGLMPARLAGTGVGVCLVNTGIVCFIASRIASACCLTSGFFLISDMSGPSYEPD